MALFGLGILAPFDGHPGLYRWQYFLTYLSAGLAWIYGINNNLANMGEEPQNMTKETYLTTASLEVIEKPSKRRRTLLPWWIKVFCWFFMFFGIMAIVCLFLGLTNVKPALAFYGFETNEPFSPVGLLVIVVGILKGVTAFALWFEKDYAIEIGKIDGITGMVLCLVSMVVLPFLQDPFHLVVRLELVLLIPFVNKLNTIRKEWESLKT